MTQDEQQMHDLFLNLAEQVKQPLTQILHAAELLDNTTIEPHRSTITLASQSAVRLIDGYLLGVRLQHEGQLQLESVSISSLLYDTAEKLYDAARAHGCEIELHVAGKYAPVLSYKPALAAALTAIGHSFIDAYAAQKTKRVHVIKLAARRTAGGISAGVFSDQAALSNELLDRARKLSGKSHQPMPEFVSDAAAGIFVADRLFTYLQSPMRASRLQGLSGLSATFAPSRQLSLV